MRFFIVRPWALSLLLVQLALSIQLPASYDTVWTTQSINSAGSMPVGGGDVSLNVWVQSGMEESYKSQSTHVNRLSRSGLILYCKGRSLRREQFSSETGSHSSYSGTKSVCTERDSL